MIHCEMEHVEVSLRAEVDYFHHLPLESEHLEGSRFAPDDLIDFFHHYVRCCQIRQFSCVVKAE